MNKLRNPSSLIRSFWALSDQGIVSLGNFFTTILLARALPQAEYAIYALTLGILLSANSLHAALITYPLSVKGAAIDKEVLKRFTGGSLVLTTGLVLALNLALFAALSVLGRPELAPWVFGVSLFWQLQETLRRALISQLRHNEVVWGDGISYLGQAVMVWLLTQEKWLSLDAVFVVIMLTSAAAAAVQSIQLGIKSMNFAELRVLSKDFWNFGRWILLTNLLGSLSIQVFPWSLKFFHGLQATASFQVVANVLGVSHPVLFSLGSLIMPAVVQANLKGNMQDVWKATWKYAFLGGALVLPYYAVLFCWPREMLTAFYGSNSPYLNLGLETPLRIYVLSYALMYFSLVLQALLYGLEDSRAVSSVQVISTVTSIILGVPLVLYNGVLGAALGTVCISISSLISFSFLIRKKSLA
jgi:O-antigen/teichoic acid export membrane protein